MNSFRHKLRKSLILLVLTTVVTDADTTPPVGLVHQVPTLTPQEELKTIQVPEGYKLELVLDDTQIKEPVLCVFDGDGRMYVAEMHSYMQDIDGTNEFAPTSRISRHVSSKGDGVFDQHSIYLDKMILPRMVLPLDDRVLVNVTNTNDITINRDTKGNGIADTSAIWYNGGPRGGNLEHQQSGLTWGLDNWIYATYNNWRLRWNGDKPPLKESIPANGGQWGLAQDDYGKMWWSNAGGEKGLYNFQVPILYGAINANAQKPTDFDKVWPLVALGDFQGGPKRFQSPDHKALNYFTACGGQTIFRGDRLPADLRGNALLPDAAGRLIRRATVTVEDGITKLSNPYGNNEFIRSSDPNFRPINVTTGPDGCLYIVDMYRGIIQEGNWTRKGSFLRDRILENGMESVVGHGRIWRLVHKDFKPRPFPHMLEETPSQLVAHLSDPNGWWRDTAQKLLVIKNDPSVVPALKKMATSAENPIVRIHALWTLEGMNALKPEIVKTTLADSNPLLRVQGIRLAETLVKRSGADLAPAIEALARDSSADVQLQVMMTLKYLALHDWKSRCVMILATTKSAGVKELGNKVLYGKLNGDFRKFSKPDQASLNRGQDIFQTVCFACHGLDGKGAPVAGSAGLTLTPPLAASSVVAHGDDIVRILLHGLSGTARGKTYESQMMSMGNNSDVWLADITSYVRNSFDNHASVISPDQVKQLRAATAGRTAPWTEAELSALPASPKSDIQFINKTNNAPSKGQ